MPDSELSNVDSFLLKYYENEKSHIDHLKHNMMITQLSSKTLENIISETCELFIYKLKKINYNCMRIFCTIKYECFVTNREVEEIIIIPFNMGRIDITNLEEFREYFHEKTYSILEKEYTMVLKVHEFTMSVLKYDPLVASSYTALPDYIKNTNSIINIKNKDEKCFLWCCIASRHLPERDSERIKQYEKYEDEFIYDEIDMPMKLNKISKFEKKE